MSPLARGKPATQGYRAGAPASKAPQTRGAVGSGEDQSEAGRRAPLSQRGRSSHRSVRPGCSTPSSRSNPEPRATLGPRTQSSYEGRGPAGLDPSSKKSRKTWRSPRLERRTGPRQSSKRSGRLAGLNTKRISEKIGQKQISSLILGILGITELEVL